MDQNTINIIFAALFAILFMLYYSKNQYENLTPLSNESLQNLSSVYNNGVLTVGSIVTTGNATIGGNTIINGDLSAKGSSSLGMWTIKNDSIGIPGRGDLNFATDKWVRLLNYGQPSTGTYAGSGGGGGFAGLNLYSDNDIRAVNVNTKNVNATGDISAKYNITSRDKRVLYEGIKFAIQAGTTAFLSDQGGWRGLPTGDINKKEIMYPVILDF